MAVTFDGDNLRIILESGVITLDVEQQLYSDWKEWFKTGSNSKYPLAFRTFGGDPLSASLDAGAYFMFQNQNGWRIRPPEEDITINVVGNIAPEAPALPVVVPTLGGYTALLLGLQPVTQNVDSIPGNVWEEELSEHNNLGTTGCAANDISYTDKFIYVNTEAALGGDGKSSTPFDNFPDAVDFAETVGWSKIVLLTDTTIDRTLKNFTIIGVGSPTIDFNGQNVDKSEFFNVQLTGQQVGTVETRECDLLDGLTGMSGHYKDSGLHGTISLGNGSQVVITLSSSHIAGLTAPTIDFIVGYINQQFSMRGYSGGLNIQNMDDITNIATLEFIAGKCNLDATNTAGICSVRGLPEDALTNDSNGLIVETDSMLPSAGSIWEEELADHDNAGKYGHEVATKADLRAQASTVYMNPISSTIIYGVENSGTSADIAVRDSVYWEIGEDVTNGITVEHTFNLPDTDCRPGIFTIFGRYSGVPANTHHQELQAYNYESTAWEILEEDFLSGGQTSDETHIHEYFERNIDRDNNNEVKIRTVHHTPATYNASHSMFLDLVELSCIEIVTAVDIADAILSADTSAYTTPGTVGGILNFMSDIEGGRWKRTGTQMIFYKSDNVTEVARFDLLDAAGQPATGEDNPFERTRV